MANEINDLFERLNSDNYQVCKVLIVEFIEKHMNEIVRRIQIVYGSSLPPNVEDRIIEKISYSAFISRKRFKPYENKHIEKAFLDWILGIARYKTINEKNRNKKEIRWTSSDFDNIASSEEPVHVQYERELDVTACSETLDRVLDEYKYPECVKTFRLRYKEELEPKDIADVQKVPYNTIISRLQRMIKYLKNHKAIKEKCANLV